MTFGVPSIAYTRRAPSMEARHGDWFEMMTEVAEAANGVQDRVISDLSSVHRVTCFSRVQSGFYCGRTTQQNTKGFVVGIRPEAILKAVSMCNFFPVIYGNERPVVPHPYVRALELPELITALTYKSKEWAHEDEVRLLAQVDAMTREVVTGDGKERWFLPIPTDAFCEVILGSRCSESTEREIRQAIASSRVSVQLLRASLHPERFDFDFTPI